MSNQVSDLSFPEFQGNYFLPGTPAYIRANEQYATSTYQKERPMNPRGILQPSSMEDVRIVIQNASQHGIPVALRTGGHQYSGASSTGPNGIILDLKHTFRRPNVDLRVSYEGEKAYLHSSVSFKLSELFDFLKDHKVFMPTGQCAEVHLGGHVQTGGFGMLARSIGLLADYVREIDIVDYEGEIVKVTQATHPDLFFGILGGSPGNFGVVTHYKIEVQQDKNHIGSKGMWLAYHYRDNTYKELLDILVKKANDPDLPRGYDLTINVISRKTSLRDQFPGTDEELLALLLDSDLPDEECQNPSVLFNWKYAMIIVWAQWVKIDGEPDYSPELFNSLLNVDRGTGKFRIVKPSPSTFGMSDIAAMWLFAGKREFDLPYIKRTYSTKKLTSDKWQEWFTTRVNDVVFHKNNGLWLSTQLQVYGGKNSMYIKNAHNPNGTAYCNRDAIISGTWDVFYSDGSPGPDMKPTPVKRAEAEAWQKANDDGFFAHFSETDRRILWGSWGDWDLSKPEVWKCYYDEATYNKVRGLRKQYDPHGTFSYTPFAVPAAE